MKLYEGMYIVTNDLASQGWENVEAAVKDSITRFDGEVIRLKKWSERPFAYPIEKQRSGVYVLVHFNADPSAIAKIENRIQITPEILRILVTTLDEKYAEESFAKEPGDADLIQFEDSSFADEDYDDSAGDIDEMDGGAGALQCS